MGYLLAGNELRTKLPNDQAGIKPKHVYKEREKQRRQ